MKKKLSSWPIKNKLHCMKLGFDLFINDDGILRIQKIDDPKGVGEDNGIKIPALRDDAAALRVAKNCARRGDRIAALAVKRHLTVSTVTIR